MAAPNRRGGSGRKKIVIRRIEQEDARFVCYSKRRQGFFSKATDLAVLTGAQVAALAFSPRGRAFSFGHPSVDSVVERFLAGEAAGARAREEAAADDRLLAGEGAGEGAAGEDEKLEKLQQEFDELRMELAEVKKQTKRTEKAMAKERSAGDQIAAWFDTKARDMGDEDMAAFFAALMQVKDAVSDRANQVLLEAMHAHMSRMAEVAPPLPPPQIFGGSTFEFGSSSGTANDGMEFQFLAPPPQEQGFEAGMDMQQMVMAPPPTSHVVAAGMDVQDMPPPPGLAAGMDLEQMQMTMPKPPGFDAGLDKEIDQWLDVMLPRPEFTAGMETVQQGLDQPNAGFPY
ncbi:MADS-box transcription factor 47-like [Triticum dicoccoides]|uniref:MADS-box transcription factor 47-like n=1 Tax=Triticum dicoccoides TaxID=85692 RepID=UPI0018909FA8|nr:MADS-box transcription factor 47-like [Triticum dicoccoides]